MVCCSPEPRRVGMSYSDLNQNVTNLAIAIAATNACTNKVLHLNYNGTCITPRSGPRPFRILNGCRQVLAVALLRAKGRDGGKNKFVGQRQKFLFELESVLAEEHFQNFNGNHTIVFPRPGS